MENYKYISEPRKPFFSVGKVLIALLIILFNFWSFDVFAGYSNVYECNRDSSSVGISLNYDNLLHRQNHGSSGSAGMRASSYNKNYKLVINNHSYKTYAVGCLLTDEPQPQVHERQYLLRTCDNANARKGTINSITQGVTGKTLVKSYPSGKYIYNSLEYKFKADYEWDSPSGIIPLTYHACDLTNAPDKTVVITTCNYGDKLTDMQPSALSGWNSGSFGYNSIDYRFNFEDDENIYYSCDLDHQYDAICHEGNSLAVTSFNVPLIKDYPRHLSTNKMGFQGCLYDVSLTQDVDNKWDGNCYNATFFRTDTPSDQKVNVDFDPYACVVKTCPNGQELDYQGICQNVEIQCPVGQHSEYGACVANGVLSHHFYVSSCSGAYSTGGQNYSACTGGEFPSTSSIVSLLRSVDKRHIISSVPDFHARGVSMVVTYKILDSSGDVTDRTATNRITVGAAFKKYYNCPAGTSVESSTTISGCKKICPSGLEVSYTADCSSTIQQCPDGTSLPSDQNCSTKICSDGSQIPFDYSCPVAGGGDGNNGAGSFDDAAILAAFKTTTTTLSQKLDTNTTTLGSKLDTNTSTLGSKLDTNTSTLGSKLDTNTSTLGSKLDNMTNVLGDKIDNSGLGSLEDTITYTTNNSTISDLFNSASVDALNTSNEELVTDIEERTAEVKQELFEKFKIEAGSASLNENNLDLGKWGIHDVSIDRFSEHFGLVRSIVLFLAAVTSLFIVIGSVSP